MTRKGATKSRNGCGTCKRRKVKCDEGKPGCLRCSSTGRTCDGYASRDNPNSLVPLRASPSYFNQPMEARSLQFFRLCVAGAISGPFSSSFWTNFVLQTAIAEPLIRHSIVTISLLYESYASKQGPQKQLQYYQDALSHYNAAIQKLRLIQYQPLVLLACLLFICIEAMQGNADQALIHIQAGLRILHATKDDAPWMKSFLKPIFDRLRVLPFLYGRDDLQVPMGVIRLPSDFNSLEEAEQHITDLFCRAVHLVCQGGKYRFGKGVSEPVAPELLAVQSNLLIKVEWARKAIGELERRYPHSKDEEAIYLRVQITIRTSKIYTRMAFERCEMEFDQFLGDFQQITDLMERLGHEMGQNATDSTFRLEVGYTMTLYIVVINCRDLATRLKALGLLAKYGSSRESLWESKQLLFVGKCIIEVEHDLTLDEFGRPIGSVSWTVLPEEFKRVRHTVGQSQELLVEAQSGGEPSDQEELGFVVSVVGKRICFRRGTTTRYFDAVPPDNESASVLNP